MNFKNFSGLQIVSSLENHFALERQTTYNILLHLREIQRRKVYADFAYSTLRVMLVKHFNQSEAAAQQRLDALKMMDAVPAVAGLLKTGKVNLTTLAMTQKHIRREEKLAKRSVAPAEKAELVERITGKTMDEAEKEILSLLPAAASIPENFQKRISPDLTRLALNFPDHVLEKLRKLKDRWAAVDPDIDYVEIISRAADIAIERTDKKGRRNSESESRVVPRGQRPTYYPVKVDEQLWIRARSQCEFVDRSTGRRCSSTFGLERDHIVPLGRGGSNELSNLRLLCRAHNQLMARRHYGEYNVSYESRNT